MKSLLSLIISSTLLCATTAHAEQLIDLSVVDRDTGKTLLTHEFEGKQYIAGTPGHRYTIHLVNRTDRRVLTVLSVDGINAMTGETANPNQGGYVLAPYQSYDVNGWRKSTEEVAQFNFTALSNSYAARTDRPNNVGVIGVAVFREEVPQKIEEANVGLAREPAKPSVHPDPMPNEANDSLEHSVSRESAPAPPPMSQPSTTGELPVHAKRAREVEKPNDYRKADIASTDGPLGTGHGARESSHIEMVEFTRETSQPNQVISVYYDSYRNLVAHGVISAPSPQAFPPSFVPDPKH